MLLLLRLKGVYRSCDGSGRGRNSSGKSDCRKANRAFQHVERELRQGGRGWLAEYQFDIVHIATGLASLSLAGWPGLRHPVVFLLRFLHDCPTIRLTDENDSFCGGTCTATTASASRAVEDEQIPPR